MKFFTTTAFSIIIVSLISLVATAPIELERRDVFVPPIISPDSSSVWKCGSNQTVTWCVSPDFFFSIATSDPFHLYY